MITFLFEYGYVSPLSHIIEKKALSGKTLLYCTRCNSPTVTWAHKCQVPEPVIKMVCVCGKEMETCGTGFVCPECGEFSDEDMA